MQTDKDAAVSGGGRKGPVTPKEVEFYGSGCGRLERNFLRQGFSAAVKTFPLSVYKNHTCSVWKAKKAQKNSKENRNKK